MERESFKEYSESAIVEELFAMKSCVEELHTFLLMRRDISLEVRTEEAGKEFQAAEELNGKIITFF